MEVIKSHNVVITTIRVETVVTSNTNVVRSGVLIGSATNLGRGLGEVFVGKKLNRSLGKPSVITGVVVTP
jgi:hypothetical protein